MHFRNPIPKLHKRIAENQPVDLVLVYDGDACQDRTEVTVVAWDQAAISMGDG